MKLLDRALSAIRNMSPRTRRLLLHDAGVFVAAFVATGVLAHGDLTVDALAGAAVAAFKVTLRQVLPVPPAAAK